MRARPIDLAAVGAPGIVIVDACRERRQQLDDLLFGHGRQPAVAVRTPCEWLEERHQVIPLYDLAQLFAGVIRAHLVPVFDGGSHEQPTVARKQDPLFRAGDLSQGLVVVPIGVSRVEPQQA